MAVYRVQRTRDYTVMSNYHLKDKGLTLKSKGLLYDPVAPRGVELHYKRACFHL